MGPQVKNVRTHALDNRMESFFLAETTKYLYLLFDPENFLHNPGTTASVVDTPRGPCVLHAGGYVFNTGERACCHVKYHTGREITCFESTLLSIFRWRWMVEKHATADVLLSV